MTDFTSTSPTVSRPAVRKLGYYSPSQNGLVVAADGISPCVCGGGRGHDIDTPKILIAYD